MSESINQSISYSLSPSPSQPFIQAFLELFNQSVDRSVTQLLLSQTTQELNTQRNERRMFVLPSRLSRGNISVDCKRKKGKQKEI